MPIYQTPADKERERDIVRQVSTRWNCEAVEFPPLCPVDWYFRRGPKLVAMVEVKIKNQTATQFADVLVDVEKYWALMFSALAFAVPSLFVLGFTDGIWYVDVRKLAGLPVLVCGRTDRQTYDQGPCFKVPVAMLKGMSI